MLYNILYNSGNRRINLEEVAAISILNSLEKLETNFVKRLGIIPSLYKFSVYGTECFRINKKYQQIISIIIQSKNGIIIETHDSLFIAFRKQFKYHNNLIWTIEDFFQIEQNIKTWIKEKGNLNFKYFRAESSTKKFTKFGKKIYYMLPNNIKINISSTICSLF